MTAYQNTPFKPSPNLITSGRPSYVFGSYDDKSSPTSGWVISDSATGTTGTLVFQIVSGNALQTPSLNGAQITVQGTSNSSGAFNVTNATILTAVTNTETGVCTVTYTIAATSQASTPDFGTVIVPVPEVGEAISGNEASVPVAAPFQNPQTNQGRVVTAVISFPGGNPTTATVTLQEAVQDLASEYQDIGLVCTVAGGMITAGPIASVTSVDGRFYRLNVTNYTGSATTIIGKISA